MQLAPPTTAVGIDLGSSTTTVSTRRGDGQPESQRFHPAATAQPTVDDGDTTEAGDAQEPRTARPDQSEGPAPVALAVQASWDHERCRQHAEAATEAGFERAVLVPEPEAAARYLADVQGEELEPGTRLVVYTLGAGSCRVDVVHREADRYVVDAALRADEVGGSEFDRVLLSYLSDRNRASDPDFWERVDDAGETALRTALLDEIRRARERLTDHPTGAIALPAGRPQWFLTREELDRCLTPAVAQTVALIETALDEAGIGTEWTAGLLLVGGASRTPLVASMIRDRLDLEPILPEMPEGVLAEGAALTALAHAQSEGAAQTPVEPRVQSRLQPSKGVLAAVSAVFAVFLAIIVAVVMTRVGPDEEPESGFLAEDPGVSRATDTVDEPTPGVAESGDSGGEADETATHQSSASPEESDEGPSTTTIATPEDPAPTTGGSGGGGEPTEDEEPDSSSGAVPNVVGMSASQAKRTLAEAGFTNVSADGSRRTGNDYEDCETTAQTPADGTRQDYGKQVTVRYVYVGTDSC